MNVPEKYVKAVDALYANPLFNVEMEGYESTWVQQETGIRQGCPLSPYLFIVLMTCLFNDIRKNVKLELKEHRVTGMDTDQILYADDTICISEDEDAMNRLLHAIETEGLTYCLKLNKTKCEYIKLGEAKRVKLHDGTNVPLMHEVKHLGCNMNDIADPEREVKKRRIDCMITLNKLHIVFYNSDNTPQRKLLIFNAIIRSKMMHGLETVVMNTRVLNLLDTFQLKFRRTS